MLMMGEGPYPGVMWSVVAGENRGSIESRKHVHIVNLEFISLNSVLLFDPQDSPTFKLILKD